MEGGVPDVAAEWHGHIDHDKVAWKAAQIATMYGEALLVIESNTLETEGTEGDNFEYILDEIAGHYDNLYSRTPIDQIRQGAPKRWGFHTNSIYCSLFTRSYSCCTIYCIYCYICTAIKAYTINCPSCL